MTKNSLRFAFLIAISAVCIYFIFFGKRGIVKYYEVAREIQHEKAKLVKLEQENEQLKAKIDKWEKDNFEKEKFVRQNLQMSKPDEMVFVTTQT